jgi:hypothetical protein
MASQSKAELESLDCMGPSPRDTNPFESIKKAFLEGFCAPHDISGNKSDNHIVTTNPSAENKSPLDIGPDPVIHVHPFDNLKKVLQGFCDPDQPSRQSGDRCDNSLQVLTQSSYDSEDTARKGRSKDTLDDDEEEEEEEEKEVVVVTMPGTGRIVRVRLGLETFFSTLGVLFITWYLLQRIGENLGLEVHSTKPGEDVAFFSITPRL